MGSTYSWRCDDVAGKTTSLEPEFVQISTLSSLVGSSGQFFKQSKLAFIFYSLDNVPLLEEC